jgi:uncharacterized protein (TIGR00251 family)
MAQRDVRVHAGKKGAVLTLRVIPRARKNEIVEILSNGVIKIHLTAPPVEGKANEALLKFLARILDIPVSNIEIVSGSRGRDKVISVSNMDVQMLHQKITKQIS